MTSETPRLNPGGTIAQRRKKRGPDLVDELAVTAAGEELGAEVLELARQLVRLQPDLRPGDERALTLLVVLSLAATREGSTRLPLAEGLADGYLHDLAETFVGEDAEAWLERIRQVVAEEVAPLVIGRPGEYRPLIVDGGWLYHQRLAFYEDRLMRALKVRLGPVDQTWPLEDLRAAAESVFEAPPALEDGGSMELSPEQKYAVLTATSCPLTIITGGPGTGKTSIVVSLYRMLGRLGVEPDRIAFAAPTGKAANRLGESIRDQLERIPELDEIDRTLANRYPEPQTLHRLLGYSPRRGIFRRDEDDPLEADWVIVDEASMIDVVLMERLLRAVHPAAHLVLLGDAEQLPSVESGTVLRDLVPDPISTRTPWRQLVDEVPEKASESPGDHQVVRLTHNYRMDASDPAGRAILTAAELIRVGSPSAMASGEVQDKEEEREEGQFVERVYVSDLEMRGVEWLRTDPEDDPRRSRQVLLNFLEYWFSTRIRGLEDLDSLTLERVWDFEEGDFSPEDVVDLRRLFDHYNRFRILCLTRVWTTGSDAINELFHRRFLQRTALEAQPQFAPGEPVIMLRNDYDRGLFNGDQGLVLRVGTDGEERLMAVFPRDDGFEAHHLPALRGYLDHAFAMTVHKAQGSEFREVAVVMPEEDIPLVSREILYTGVTRSRRSVVLIGSEALLRAAIDRPVRRFTGLRPFSDNEPVPTSSTHDSETGKPV